MSMWIHDTRSRVLSLPASLPPLTLIDVSSVATTRPCCRLSVIPCNTPWEQVRYSSRASPNLAARIQNEVFIRQFSHAHTGSTVGARISASPAICQTLAHQQMVELKAIQSANILNLMYYIHSL